MSSCKALVNNSGGERLTARHLLARQVGDNSMDISYLSEADVRVVNRPNIVNKLADHRGNLAIGAGMLAILGCEYALFRFGVAFRETALSYLFAGGVAAYARLNGEPAEPRQTILSQSLNRARQDPSRSQLKHYGYNIELPLSFGEREVTYGAESVRRTTAENLTELSQGVPGFHFFKCLDAYAGQISPAEMLGSMTDTLINDDDLEMLLTASKPDLYDMSTAGSRLWIKEQSPSWDHTEEFDLEQEQSRFAAGCLGMIGTFLDIRKRHLRPFAAEYSARDGGCNSSSYVTDLISRLNDSDTLLPFTELQGAFNTMAANAGS